MFGLFVRDVVMDRGSADRNPLRASRSALVFSILLERRPVFNESHTIRSASGNLQKNLKDRDGHRQVCSTSSEDS